LVAIAEINALFLVWLGPVSHSRCTAANGCWRTIMGNHESVVVVIPQAVFHSLVPKATLFVTGMSEG
jgi:hypothetical protein